MASTPSPTPPQPQPLRIKTAARKLPVKRKTPDTPSSAHTFKSGLSPKPKPSCSSLVPNPIPKLETADDEDDNIIDGKDLVGAAGDDLKPAPFKFHRIWLESDEIRFLRSLLDCSADGLVFPRDLPLFYDRFSQSIPQPYTKSQLSEKLRRLRKKFRVISTRISRGLDPSLLSPHDRALFDFSKQLWHPSYASSSPFQSNKRKPSEVRFSVYPNPSISLPFAPPAPAVQGPRSANINDVNIVEEDIELNLEPNLCGQEHCLPLSDYFGTSSGSGGGGLGQFAAKAIMDVFDRSLKEVKMTLVRRGLLSTTAGSLKQGKAGDFVKRWREQRVAELDVLARRLRLGPENANQWMMKAPRPP